MAYRVIVIEDDPDMLEEIVAVFRRSSDFEVASTYKQAYAAINPAGMFQPNLFLMNVDNEETLNLVPDFVEKFPNAHVLGMMSQWNPDIAQKVAEGNATGCILKPFTDKELLEYIKLYSKRGQRKPAKLVSFFSPKGRAGRTTLAAILALLIAEKTNERVALVDADLQFGDLPIFFDLEPKRTVIDATQDIKLLSPITFEPYFYTIKKNVSLLSSPDRPEYAELVAPDALTEVIQMTKNVFRYVLVDLPAGFNPLALGICRISDIVLVTTMINSGFEIKHAKKAMDMFEQYASERSKIHAVFTRVNPFTEEERLKISLNLGYYVDDIIPNEYKMISIANSGRLVQGLPKDGLLMQVIGGMADKIINAKER